MDPDDAAGHVRYRGRRRVAGPGPFGGRRLVLAAVVAGSVAVMGVVAFAVWSHPPAGRSPDALSPGGTDPVPVVTDTDLSPAGGSASARPSPRDTAQPGAPTPPPLPTLEPSPSLTPSPTAGPRPGPVTYEAEAAANTVSGSARISNYDGASGGRIVRNLGLWNGPGSAGTLTFGNVTAPEAGPYHLTFFYVYLNAEPARTAVITVAGAEPISVTAGGGSTCCASRTVTVVLRAGANTITFGNPNGHAPSIDKIVIGGP
jgi:hypothetical protein